MPVQIFHYSDLENAYDSPERLARFVGFIETHRDEDAIVVGSGDSLSPSVLSLVTDAEQTLDVFRALIPDAETIGNHDFDLGIDTLADIIAISPQTWVSTNLKHKTDRLTNAGVRPYTVVHTGDTSVGILGVTTPKLPAMNHHATDVEVRDPVETIEDHAARIRARHDVDAVVVLSHLDAERALATQLDAPVDAILGGHDHDPISAVVDGVPVARPGANGSHVIELELGDSPEIARHHVGDASPHSGVRNALQEYITDAGLNESIATVSEPVSLQKAAGAQGESRIGNFVTDAYRWVAGTDVAVLAARAIRTGDFLTETVTPFDLINVVPFADDLVVLELTGNKLAEVFRDLDHRDAPTMRDWYFGHVSGAELVWEEPRTLEHATVDGSPLDPAETYELATSSYYVETDHIFTALDKVNVIERMGPQYDSLVDYTRECGINPEIEGRIVRPGDI